MGLESSNRTVLLLDASSYLFRAYYAIPPLSNSEGVPTHATYGFTQMLLKLLADHPPTHFVALWDRKEPTFRKKIFEAYKQNRKETPKDLLEQIPWIKKILSAMRVPALEIPGYEADDLIATLTKKAEAAGFKVVILTPDKDLMQLVSAQTRLLDSMKDKWVDEKEVQKRFGVSPNQVVDVLALAGDASDNVPGVPGIGGKTASSLIAHFKNLENLYAHLDEVKGAKKNLLAQYKDQAFLSKKLVTLEEQAPILDPIDKFAYTDFDAQDLVPLFEKLEFHRLLKEFRPHAKKDHSLKYKLVLSTESFHCLIDDLKSHSSFTFDTETDSSEFYLAKLVGISFSFENQHTYYLPLRHHVASSTQLDVQMVLNELRPFFEDEKKAKYAQNFKYDYQILQNEGIQAVGLVCDTMVASYLLDPASSHGLKNLSSRYLHHTMMTYEEVVTHQKRSSFAEVPLEEALSYAGEDAEMTRRLAELFLKKLVENNLDKVFEEIEIPLVPILAEMERAGIRIDRPFLQSLQFNFEKRMRQIEEEIYQFSETPFNIQSTKQLGELLFERLKLPVQRKTKTGYSTDSDTLFELAKLHPLPQKIIDFRTLAKLKSTYVDALLVLTDDQNDRVHTSFNQTIAETGRLSSSSPNLQNIPIRTEDGKKLRRAFIPREDCVLLCADYSQIELRILAHLSEDPHLVAAFCKNHDIHAMTAASLFRVPLSEVTSSLRSIGKTVNFGVIYGQSAFSLAAQLGIPVSQAKQHIDEYFGYYSAVQIYRDQVLDLARNEKQVRTLLGRLRQIPDIHSKNPSVRANAERVAFNTVIQGTAADLIKLAMIAISRMLKKKQLHSQLLLQVHDELVFEVPNNEVEAMKQHVLVAMEKVFPLCVPLKVDLHVGKSWEK